MTLFQAALGAVHGRRCMRAALAGRQDRDVWLLAVGKAAGAMTLGALDVLGDAVRHALVVSKEGHFEAGLAAHRGVRCITGGHPLPDQGSLEAGAAMLEMACAAPPGQRLLVLVSGGASSLAEVLPPGVSLEALRDANAWASATGLEIASVNALRRSLSRIKGGRLAAALGHCRAEGFFISDVPDNDPAVVGSGLLAAGARAAVPDELPDWLARLTGRAPPAPAAATRLPATCIADLGQALTAVRDAAGEAGLPVTVREHRLDGDAEAAARELCGMLRSARPGLYACGGETTVRLPPRPGRGGRNQHLALAAARCLEAERDTLLLACGTDGTDGNSRDAGAIVDGDTLQRGRDGGRDPLACLTAADSGGFLEASGDLVHTGPTGTNVGDLLIALRGDLLHSRGA